MIIETTSKYPQDSYAVVGCAIQSEWIFLQHVTWDTGDVFTGVEKMIREIFLLRIFVGKKNSLSPIVGALIKMPVKKDVLGPLNPVTSANEKYLSSQRGSAELIQSVTGVGAFSNANHLLALREERRDGQENGMTLMKPHSRVQSKTSKVPISA